MNPTHNPYTTRDQLFDLAKTVYSPFTILTPHHQFIRPALDRKIESTHLMITPRSWLILS